MLTEAIKGLMVTSTFMVSVYPCGGRPAGSFWDCKSLAASGTYRPNNNLFMGVGMDGLLAAEV